MGKSKKRKKEKAVESTDSESDSPESETSSSTSSSSSSSSSSDSSDSDTARRDAAKKRKKLKRKDKKSKKKRRSSKKDIPRVKISKDDYYRRSREFRLWLKVDKRKPFDTLMAAESRKRFLDFAKLWNAGRLRKEVYRCGGGEDEPATTNTTSSKSSVGKSIEKYAATSSTAVAATSADQPQVGPSSADWAARSTAFVAPKQIGPTMPSAADWEDVEEAEAARRCASEAEYASLRARHAEEELLPARATPGTHAARQEKRATKRAERAARGASPDVPASALMGESGDAFQRRLAARRAGRDARRESRANAALEKTQSYQEKEREKMAALLEFAKAAKAPGSLWASK